MSTRVAGAGVRTTGRVGGVGGRRRLYAATVSRASIRAGKRGGAHDDVAEEERVLVPRQLVHHPINDHERDRVLRFPSGCPDMGCCGEAIHPK